MEILPTAGGFSAAKTLTFGGFAFILLAFAMPFIAPAIGFIPVGYFAPGELIGFIVRTGTSLLVIRVGASAFVREGAGLAAAKGWLVTGILLCAVAGQDLGRIGIAENAAKYFEREVLQLTAEQARTWTDFNQRFATVDISNVASPENLTTQAGLARARATIEQYKAWLAERRALQQMNNADFERMVRAHPFSVSARARDRFDVATKAWIKLDMTQTDLADALTAVFDWGVSQRGTLGTRDGQLLFSTPAQKEALKGLVAKLNEAEHRQNEALKVTGKIPATGRESIQDPGHPLLNVDIEQKDD